MPAIAVVGAQWGDEGKGKIVDLLAEKVAMVVRYSGGNNAGHTVVNQYGEFRLHLVPSGIFYPYVTCVIGNGVVVNPAALLEELDMLQKARVNTSRLFVSSRAHLIMPYHILLDSLEEKARGASAIGTTGMGIGPAFVDKVARQGIRVSDLLDKNAFLARLRPVLEQKNALITKIFGAPPLSLEEIYGKYCSYGERLAPRVRETDLLVEEALEKKEAVLLEGAQGTLLDIDFGTYPFVTSSSPIAGGACAGVGLNPTRIRSVVGVCKAYITRVGGGPLPTELKDETGQLIRERAHEYGATTGRPRRCGWFDAVATRFSTRINGFTSIALTRLDVLDILPAIKICVAYKIDGRTTEHFPSTVAELEKCQPVYEELPGWNSPTSEIRRFKDLPLRARRYVRRLEKLLRCPASLISVGPRREQTIEVKTLL